MSVFLLNYRFFLCIILRILKKAVYFFKKYGNNYNMIYKRVFIESFGYALPKKVLTTCEIEDRLAPLYKRLRLPYGRLEQFSGIKERRYWENGIMPSDASIQAAQNAFQKASYIKRSDIGCILHTSVCRDFLEPATSNLVHDSLGLREDCTVYDISNACLGFLNGIITVADKIELGHIDAGIVVTGENGKPVLDTTINKLINDTTLSRKEVKKYIASLTLGSGAAAAILCGEKLSTKGHRLLGGVVNSSTKHNNLCRSTPDKGIFSGEEVIMNTDSEGVLINGCNLAKKTWALLRKELSWAADSADRYFCHQIGTAHKNMLFKTLGIKETNDFSTVEFLGNVGSASLPITVAMGEEKGIVKKDDTVALLGIGSGLNCIMLGVNW
jgi:3-oxoacyl-[acyl-carrier-protein] synthase-3